MLKNLENFLFTLFPSEWKGHYNQLVESNASSSLPLTNPLEAALVPVAYVASVFLLKAVMRHQRPYQIKFFSLLHNASMFLINLYVLYPLFKSLAVFGSGNAQGELFLKRVLWTFFYTRLLQFFGTAIIIFKKLNKVPLSIIVSDQIIQFSWWWAILFFAPTHVLAYRFAFVSALADTLIYAVYLSDALELPTPVTKNSTLGIHALALAANAVLSSFEFFNEDASSHTFPYSLASASLFVNYLLTAIFLVYFVLASNNRKVLVEVVEPAPPVVPLNME
eukprot:TRINITY_DN2085_c0_g1_i1.p1 TRINITY_DN2085_c0_g1~~TRINITY_DN2085_c0_g1_i1.p1  ORF type:complete len:311 (-),score=122.21 TRINITY_DN2085_c0_g1_i1:104-937(-)